MTVEAALVIPLFLFACLTLLSLLDMLRIFSETEQKLYTSARDLAVFSYTGSRQGPGDDWIRLKLVYPVSSEISLPCFSQSLLLENHVNVHIFNGYSGDTLSEKDRSEEIVFITEDGGVYHKSRSCRHLNVSIRELSFSSLSGQRSLDGSRYYLCPYCGRGYSRGELSQSSLYVADYGTRYHTRRNCPHLKRSIMAVPLSQTGGRRPCRDCG